jgi:hypothetical protein
MPSFKLPAHSYQHRSKRVGSERLVNCFAEMAPPEGKAQIAVTRAPGIAAAVTLNTLEGRGVYRWQGLLYAVSGQNFYLISSAHVATLISSSITGVGTVSFAETPTQLVICTNNATYVYNGTSVSQVTDPHFDAGVQCCSIDGYVLFRRESTGIFFASDLGDATSYDALMFATAEGLSDNIVGIIADHRQAILAGEDSMEIWYNAGISGFPFIRDANGFVELGCAAGKSLAKRDNSIYWLASDLTVRRLEGVTPVRVSQDGVEQAIAGYYVADAVGFAFSQYGHSFYVLTFPTSDATWVLDINTGEWHERQSYGLGRWRPSSAILAYSRIYVQDYETGKVGYLDIDTYTDWGDTQRMEMTFQDVYSDGNVIKHSKFELICETGVGTTGQGADPQLTLEYSNDSGKNWTTLPTKSMGEVGEYKTRVRWHRLGAARYRQYRLSISDPCKVVIADAQLEAA